MGQFFQKLVGEMKRGKSMPVVWVRLAFQGPRLTHIDVPDTFFVDELGQLAFR